MQDLLKEEEFSEVHHNPWKSFKLFQRIAFGEAVMLSIVLLILYFGHSLDGRMFFWITVFVVPVITAIIMFRFPKKNIEVSQKVKLQGISGLTIAYLLPFMATIAFVYVYQKGNRFSVTHLFFVFILELVLGAVLFGLCAFAIFVMSSFRDRRKL